ncbi:MAG: stalk domain-containing protein [Caldisericia bacterium]|nr:stalk domain-containing protein [Caldisericia bacterium]
MKKFLGIFLTLLLIFVYLPKFNLSLGLNLANETIIKEITLTPDIVGEITRIDIIFELKTVDLLANTDNIQVIFPTDPTGDAQKEFYIPNVIPKTQVLIDGSNNISDVQVDLLNKRIAVITSINLPKDLNHTLTFLLPCGIKNPTKSGFYQIKLQTNKHIQSLFSIYVKPGLFDHMVLIPDPAFVESNYYPTGGINASFGNNTILVPQPKDIYGNTIYEGFTHGFGTFVRDADDDCGINATNDPSKIIPTARWFRISDTGNPAGWRWDTPFGTGNFIYLSHPNVVGPDDTSLFIHPLYNKNLSDFILETKIAFSSTSNYHGGVKFRFNDYLTRNNPKANGYYVDFWGGNIRLVKVVNGVNTVLTTQVFTIGLANTFYNLKIVASGSNIKVYVDNTLYIDYTDPSPILTGIFGVWQYGGDATARETYWDDFYIKTLTGTTLFFDDFERKIAAPQDPPEDGHDANFRYCDTNGNGFYDQLDCIYFDTDNSKTVSRGDIRISGSFYAGSTPGTVVKTLDPDLGRPLEYLYTFPNPTNGTIVKLSDEDDGNALSVFSANERFVDRDNSGSYSPADWIYYSLDGTVNAGDKRLSNVNFGGKYYKAGTTVLGIDADVGLSLTAFGGNLKYVDKDSSGSYSPGERIYIDNNTNNLVDTNDTRLFTPSLRFLDTNTNDVFDACDFIYLDLDNSRSVTPGDVRMTPISFWTKDGKFYHYEAGTTVKDDGFNTDFDAKPYNPYIEQYKFFELKDISIYNGESYLSYYPIIYRFYDDNNNKVWDDNEPVQFYIDFKSNKIVDSGDLRISQPFFMSWSISTGGGTIDRNGFYTSPVITGPPQQHTITCNLTIGAITRTVTSKVVVFLGPPKVVISPQIIWIAPCTNYQFKATVTDKNNNSIPFAENFVNWGVGYPKNSKVDFSPDKDKNLFNFVPGIERHTENVSINGLYDAGEWIYKDMDSNGAVSYGDVRLTLVKIGTITYPAGSIVGTLCPTCEADMGRTLIDFKPNEKHTEEVSSIPIVYHIGENIYRDVDSDGKVSEGDIRLTDVKDGKGNIFPANSIVGDKDSGKSLISLTNVKFVDLNGNGTYDLGEYLYIDIDVDNKVSKNDKRLVSCACGLAPGDVSNGDGDIGTPLVSFEPLHAENLSSDGKYTPTGVDIEWTDVNGNGLFDPGTDIAPLAGDNNLIELYEYIYKDMDSSGTISIGDIRVSEVKIFDTSINDWIIYPSGSKVQFGDKDLSLAGDTPADSINLISFTSSEKFVDTNGNGLYDWGEPIYIDVDNSGTVSSGDIRLAWVSNYKPNSIVGPTDTDITHSLNSFQSSPIKFVDNNGDVAWNPGEPLYIDTNGNGIVEIGDIRLNDYEDINATIDKNGTFYSPSCGGGTYNIWASFNYNDGCPGNACGGFSIVYNSNPVFAQVTMGIKVWVTPDSISLISGERQQFFARTEDALYHTVITPSPKWSILNNDPAIPIGTIDSETGLFTASSNYHPTGYIIATVYTSCCGTISSTVPPLMPPDWAITSGFVRVNALVDVVKSSFKLCGSGFLVNIKWYIDQLGDKLKVTITTNTGYAKIIDKSPPVSTPGQWVNIPIYISAQELGLNVGQVTTVTIRGDVVPSYPSTKWWLEDYEQFEFKATPLMTVGGQTGCDGILIATIGDTLPGTLTTLSDLNFDGKLDPLNFVTITMTGPGRFDEYGNFYLEPWSSVVYTTSTDINGLFSIVTGSFNSVTGYQGAKYDGIYIIEAQTNPKVYMYIYLKYKDTITTDLSKLTVDLSTPQIIEGTLQLPGSLTPGNNDVYVELWKVDPVKGYERVNISDGPINEIVRANLPPQTYAPVKLGPNGYFKIYAIIDELGSYAIFTRVGNEKSGLGDYKYGRYYNQIGNPVPYRPFTIGAPNYKATLLVEPTVLYANKLNYFTIFVTDSSGNPLDELSLNLKDKFTFELPPGWTLQNKLVKPITKGTYLISLTPVGTGSGSLLVKVAGAVLLSLPIQPLSLYNPYAYIDLKSVRLDREMIPAVVGEEYILVFGFHQPPTPGLVVFDPAKGYEIDKDDTIFVEEISRSDTEIKLKFIPCMYTELPINLKFTLRGVDNRSDEENGKVSDSEINFKLFNKFTNILGFKIKVETAPQEIVQGGVGSISVTVLDENGVPRNNAWVEIWGYNKDGSPVGDMFNVGGATPKITIDASHLDPLNQNIVNGVYTQLNVGFNHAADPEKERTPFEVGRYTLVKVYTGDPSIPTSKIMGYLPYAFVIKPKKTLNISLLSIDGITTYNKILAGRKHQLLINAPGVPNGSEMIAIGSKGSTFVNNMNGTFTLTLGEPYLEEGEAKIVAIGPNRDTYGEIDIPIVKPKLVITPQDNILSAEINEVVTFSLFDPITNAPFYAKEVGADGKLDSYGAPFGFRTVIMNKVSLSGVSSGTLTVNGRDNKNPTLKDSPKVILYYTTNDTPVGKYVILNEFDLVSVKVTVEISTPQGTIIDKAIVNKPNRIKITVVDAHNNPILGAEVGITFAYNYAQTVYDLKGYTDNSGTVVFTDFKPKYAGGYDIVVKKQDKEYVFYDYFYAREVTEDTTPPEITILEPEDGSETQKTKIEVIGKVSDESSVTAVYVNGMRVDLLPDGTFMTYVTLDEGTNRIRVIAVDEFGNIGIKEIYVTYKPPTLTLNVEPIPSFVNTPVITIKGSTDKGATVYINDEEIDVDEEGKFETSYTLIEGLNTIVIKAEKGTLTKTKRISVTLDTTPPKLQVIIPENVLERIFEIKGTTEVGATVTINDEPVLVNPDGSFSYTLTIPVGENEIQVVVKAQDKAGNVSTVSKTVKFRREIIIEMIIDSPVIKVTKDGVTTTVIYEIAPFTMPPGRTMVPLRFIAETFGAKVDWDPKTEGIHIELKKSDGSMVIIDMQLGNKIAYVNGKPYVLDVAPFTVEPQGRTVVPIRFIAEAFGAKVDWDPVLQKVTITYYP